MILSPVYDGFSVRYPWRFALYFIINRTGEKRNLIFNAKGVIFETQREHSPNSYALPDFGILQKTFTAT